MSMKQAIKRYFTEVLVEYGCKIEMDGRNWHF